MSVPDCPSRANPSHVAAGTKSLSNAGCIAATTGQARDKAVLSHSLQSVPDGDWRLHCLALPCLGVCAGVSSQRCWMPAKPMAGCCWRHSCLAGLSV